MNGNETWRVERTVLHGMLGPYRVERTVLHTINTKLMNGIESWPVERTVLHINAASKDLACVNVLHLFNIS
jgi:hypothetical protein